MNSLGSGSSPGVAGIPEAAGSGEGTVDPESGGEGGAGGQRIETRLVGWQDTWGGAWGRPEGEREADENAQGVAGVATKEPAVSVTPALPSIRPRDPF